MPGSPPTKTIDPGTTPPPSTRSSSVKTGSKTDLLGNGHFIDRHRGFAAANRLPAAAPNRDFPLSGNSTARNPDNVQATVAIDRRIPDRQKSCAAYRFS